ncbi:hypothetical protein PoB_005025100 [Plakobranchus ocellatus]|uniref:Uncharacterized protein n=1 Tax=Plakobranchus ocellatus TaxID=259542 RepID=A0AAV4BXB1_9GAST|nr:hypothetical protein PoB_005025100 [Plakobranchus ocellatus]
MNLVHSSCGNEAGEVCVPSYQWTAFLSTLFKKFVGIEQFQYFPFLEDGSVAACSADVMEDEVICNLLKKSTKLPLSNRFSVEKKLAGLDLKRQNYLYREIREFVSDYDKDTMAPKPSVV